MARNVVVGGGEIDIIASIGHRRVAVEVRSRWGSDPLDAFGEAKHTQVWSLARQLEPPCDRVDLVAVRFGPAGVDVRWVPDIS